MINAKNYKGKWTYGGEGDELKEYIVTAQPGDTFNISYSKLNPNEYLFEVTHLDPNGDPREPAIKFTSVNGQAPINYVLFKGMSKWILRYMEVVEKGDSWELRTYARLANETTLFNPDVVDNVGEMSESITKSKDPVVWRCRKA